MSQRRYRPFDTSLVMPNRWLRALYQLAQPAIERAFGFPRLWEIYDRAKGRPAPGFADHSLQQIGIDWRISDDDLQRLTAIDGPVIVMCNHPFGGIDSLSLIALFGKIRPDQWRILSNFIVSDFPEFRDQLIPVDPLGSDGRRRDNAKALARALRFLRTGGLLGMFPASRVSHWDHQLGAIFDQAWTEHSLRLAERTGATIATLHIPGSNSDRFLKVPIRWSRLRALLLSREIGKPSVSTVDIRVADIIPASGVPKLMRAKNPAARLRARCFLRADLDVPRPEKSQSPLTDRPAVAQRSDDVADAFADLAEDAGILQISGRDVLLFRGKDAPDAVMQELGRCREITFRVAGQGVGAEVDITREDSYYHHLVVWDREATQLVGAYRMGNVQEILRTQGAGALYLDQIFKIAPEFYTHLGEAFELSRSFVMPDYQRDNRALGALWHGLGEAALLHQCRSFFGSVTISNDHHPASRAILVEHLRQHYSDRDELLRLIEARNPFIAATHYHPVVSEAYSDEKIDALAPLISDIEGGERGIPPLMRYYCSLGAKYLAFHVEPTFQDALYCLLRVDLEAIEPRYRKRFMGR